MNDLKNQLIKKINRLKELLTNFKNEEVKEKHNPKSTALIFKEFLIPLKNNIIKTLQKEIMPLFESYNNFIWTDSFAHQSEEKALEYLENNLKYICYKFQIEIRLQGFKKAGIRAFDISKQILIELDNYSYKCEIGGLAGILLEKLYHQLPDEKEIKKLTERYFEFMLDDINHHIEQISRE